MTVFQALAVFTSRNAAMLSNRRNSLSRNAQSLIANQCAASSIAAAARQKQITEITRLFHAPIAKPKQRRSKPRGSDSKNQIKHQSMAKPKRVTQCES